METDVWLASARRRAAGAARALGIVVLLLCIPAYGQETALYHFSDLPGIDAVHLQSRFFGYQSAVDRDLTGGEQAYDYSVHLIKDGDLYRLYSGGRWYRPGRGDGDHVLQHISATGAAGTWSMPRDRPEIWQGMEEGHADAWYSNNYLEPEVVKVAGIYYLYTQVQVNPGDPIDEPGKTAVTAADRIQLHTSPDGSNWSRRTWERGVVVHLEQPEQTSLHHQEVIYVPWDESGRPFWMYVAAHVGGRWIGYHRLRSDDPTTFDWRQREPANLSQLGNQIGYARQAPGGPLFVRITFAAGEGDRRVPALQFSRDGLQWFGSDEGPVLLDGSKNNDRNRDCYFLGIATIDGTGELEYLGQQTYRALYGATTSNSPGHDGIWDSEIGVGELVLRLDGGTDSPDG